MQKFLEEVKKRLESALNYTNIAVVYDFDIDGCTSASLLWRFFKANHINATFYPNSRSFQNITIERIKNQNPDKIFIIDYVPDSDFANGLKNYNVTIIDHHSHESHLEIFDYITGADYNAVGSLCYLLYKSIKKHLGNLDWLVKLSLFWDKALEGTEFYSEGIYQKEIEKYLPFNLVVCLTQTKGSEKVFEILNQSSSFEEAYKKVLELEDYKRAKETFDNEIKEITFSRKAFPDIKLNIYWIKTKFKHIRIYVDYITYQKEGTNIFIIDEVTQFKFSFRTSLDIDLVKIIKQLSSEFKNFSGGGHSKACGAILKNGQADEVINKFIDIYREHLKK